jgi:radical SAM protein with 4Fe4S-binding SPASM domain
MPYIIKAKFDAEGESYVIISDNSEFNTNLEVGQKVELYNAQEETEMEEFTFTKTRNLKLPKDCDDCELVYICAMNITRGKKFCLEARSHLKENND